MQRKNVLLNAIYLLATVQFAWCYLWITRPYVNTAMYRQGLERMPFQGRCLMMPAMKWAHNSAALNSLVRPLSLSHFWFPRSVPPEVLVQALIDVASLLLSGWFTARIYQASSRHNLLTPFVYPLLLVVCGATYIMHTVQNFRFIYDLPSLAFFSCAMYLLYFRRHWSLFAALFLVATINRETTLLLLPLFLIDECFDGSGFQWNRALKARCLCIVLPLAGAWICWEVFIRYTFRSNPSEFYRRFDWNIKSLLAPLAWPQLLSACGYLLLGVILMRRRISDPRLRAWLWIVPIWMIFMFSYGILIETRVFGELISLVVCATALIVEETIVLRFSRPAASPGLVQLKHPARKPALVAIRPAMGDVAYSVHVENPGNAL